MKEEDIRKRLEFDQYLELLKQDVELFFNPDDFIEVSCPACQGHKNHPQFNKLGFDYVLCEVCGTLYVRNRPLFNELNKFYSKSRSGDFWINSFFRPVAEARREKIFCPRAEYVNNLLESDTRMMIGDIGAGFGLFLEELSKLSPGRMVAIEPSQDMAEICRNKGLQVIECALESIQGWDEEFHLLTSFELFEHLYDPSSFLAKVWKLLRPGGKLLITTLNGEGFDIQILWEKSKSVFPPHHLNFFNPESIKLLMENSGFVVKEIATPGQLDWDIVEGMILENTRETRSFWKLVAQKGSGEAKKELQHWIVKNLFSSHMRVLAEKM